MSFPLLGKEGVRGRSVTDPPVVPPYQGGTLIRYMVDAGAVDGTTGENKYYVDNFTLRENAAVLRRLRWLMG